MLPVLIATTYRSGSTFLGDLLNHYPGTFYSFEPLQYKTKTERVKYLRNIFHCEFEMNYLHHISQNPYLVTIRNPRLGNVCKYLKNLNSDCYKQQIIQPICKIYPIRLIKTVRFSVTEAEKLLEDPTLPNFKVISLFRDPRGFMNSRSTISWCSKNPICKDPEKVCQLMTNDTRATYQLAKKYPGRVLLIRYEDLSLNPHETTEKILKFLNMTKHLEIHRFIERHTKGS